MRRLFVWLRRRRVAQQEREAERQAVVADWLRDLKEQGRRDGTGRLV